MTFTFSNGIKNTQKAEAYAIESTCDPQNLNYLGPLQKKLANPLSRKKIPLAYIKKSNSVYYCCSKKLKNCFFSEDSKFPLSKQRLPEFFLSIQSLTYGLDAVLGSSLPPSIPPSFPSYPPPSLSSLNFSWAPCMCQRLTVDGKADPGTVTTMLWLKCHSAPVGPLRARGQSEGTGFAQGRR